MPAETDNQYRLRTHSQIETHSDLFSFCQTKEQLNDIQLALSNMKSFNVLDYTLQRKSLKEKRTIL